jgi:predicted acylesterase/phospholipase RssA
VASYLHPDQPCTIIYQAAKLGDVPHLLTDLRMARRLDAEGMSIGRIFGNSSGALVAVAHGIVLAARAAPDRFTPQAADALTDFEAFFRCAKSRHIRRLNWHGLFYGFYNLDPLKRWLVERLKAYTGLNDVSNFTLSSLRPPTSIYLCAQDKDGFPVFFGPPDEHLHATYHNCSTHIEDAPVVDACIASLSTMLSTDAYPVNGHYYKDGRPAFPDISAIVLDMGAGTDDARPIIKSVPHTPLLEWPGNTISQPFIMHSWHERNQVNLTAHYNDLLYRLGALQEQVYALLARMKEHGLDNIAQEHFGDWHDPDRPRILHTDIPYIGSTEASTNMRESVANKAQLMQQSREMGGPQLEGFDFARPFNVIYGAGGFSGILAGLAMTQFVDERGGNVQRIFGCSAGVLNGLFHGVVLGARRHPDLYVPNALDGLKHLETFFEQLEPGKLFRVNKTPRALARALVNFEPFRDQLCRYIELWTGRTDGAAVTFEDIRIPFYVTVARGSDGYADFLGMPDDLEMRFAGRTIRPLDCPIVDAIIGGMAQPFYITPPVIHGETYFDGGAAFYDIGLFAAAMEPEPVSLLNMHFAEPPDHSYGFDERLNLVRVIFDTHNFTFPEERRRMRKITDLFYDYETLRRRVAHLVTVLEQAGYADIPVDCGLVASDLKGNWRRVWDPAPAAATASGSPPPMRYGQRWSELLPPASPP